MAYAIKLAGAELSKMSTEEVREALSVAEYPDSKNYQGDFINLTLQKGIARGKAPYNLLGFQTLEVSIDSLNGGGASGYLTVDRKGEPTCKYAATFTSSRFGVHTCSVPDTKFNRELIANLLNKGRFIQLSKDQLVEGIISAIDKLVKVAKSFDNYIDDYSTKEATAEVEIKFGSMIKSLKETFGEGYYQSSEYINEVVPHITKVKSSIKISMIRSCKSLSDLKDQFPMKLTKDEKSKNDAKLDAKLKAKADKVKEEESKLKEAEEESIPKPPKPPKA